MRVLVLGAQRAMTRGKEGRASIWASFMPSNSAAVLTSAEVDWVVEGWEGRIPTSLAMALAVEGWSPVSMWTLMPALVHSETASFVSIRGGSYSPARPRRVRPFSTSSRG